MSSRDRTFSGSSQDSVPVSVDFSDPVCVFQARKYLSLQKYGYNKDRCNHDDDLSEITMSEREMLYLSSSQEDISDDHSAAAAFQTRKYFSQEKYRLFRHDSNLVEAQPAAVRKQKDPLGDERRSVCETCIALSATTALALDWERVEKPSIASASNSRSENKTCI